MPTKTRPAPDEAPSAPIPDWLDDFPEDEGFLASAELTALGAHVIAKHPELNWLAEWRVDFLWKAEGGESKGNATLGRCTTAKSLLKHYSRAHWIIWLAADHLGRAEFTDRQVEAVLYHELLHCRLGGITGDIPSVRGHDAEIFYGEVVRYGLYEPGLESLHEVLAAAKAGEG